MRTKQELKEIARELSKKVKEVVLTYGMTTNLSLIKSIKEMAIETYAFQSTKYELTPEEQKKVDKYFARMLILDATRNKEKYLKDQEKYLKGQEIKSESKNDTN